MNFKLFTIITLTVLITNSAFSQKEVINFKQKDLEAYKVDSGIYNFRFQNGDSGNIRGYKKGDTLAYFTNEKEYKGLINYGIECFCVDKTNCILEEDFIMYFLDTTIEQVEFNTRDSIVRIKGTIKKSWSKKDHIAWRKEAWVDNNNVNIYVGEKRDTISKLYYEPWLLENSPDRFIYKFKGKEFKDSVVLDSFSSFYMSNYTYYKTGKGSNRPFNIKAKINPNSILVFGLKSSYSEIFEIGKLVFNDDDIRRKKFKSSRIKKRKTKPRENYFKYIIRNNVQELHKDTISKPKQPWYYKVVETAETYTINNQYAKARDEYKKLLKEEHYIFARDLNNAVRAAIISRDYKTAILWCEKLALKGVSINYYNSKVFNRLKSTKLWQSFLLKFPTLNEQYKKGLNQSLKTKLTDLVTMDQKDYVRHSKGEFERSKLNATTQRVDGKLIELIKREGFPTEEKIGIEIINDTIIITRPDYYVLINHSHQVNSNRNPEIKNILNKSAKIFEYDNVRNGLSGFVNLSTCFMLYKGNLYSKNNCTVNKRELQKMKFIFRNTYGFILDQSNLSELAFSKKNEKSDEEFMKASFNFIEKVRDNWIVED